MHQKTSQQSCASVLLLPGGDEAKIDTEIKLNCCSFLEQISSCRHRQEENLCKQTQEGPKLIRVIWTQSSCSIQQKFNNTHPTEGEKQTGADAAVSCERLKPSHSATRGRIFEEKAGSNGRVVRVSSTNPIEPPPCGTL